MGAELFHADARTDRSKLIVPFRSFANAPKNCSKNKSSLRFTRYTPNWGQLLPETIFITGDEVFTAVAMYCGL